MGVTDSKNKRRKVRENKTIMLPKPLEEIPDLPDIKLPEDKPKKRGLGLKRFFKFGKKKELEGAAEPDK